MDGVTTPLAQGAVFDMNLDVAVWGSGAHDIPHAMGERCMAVSSLNGGCRFPSSGIFRMKLAGAPGWGWIFPGGSWSTGTTATCW